MINIQKLEQIIQSNINAGYDDERVAMAVEGYLENIGYVRVLKNTENNVQADLSITNHKKKRKPNWQSIIENQIEDKYRKKLGEKQND